MNKSTSSYVMDIVTLCEIIGLGSMHSFYASKMSLNLEMQTKKTSILYD